MTDYIVENSAWKERMAFDWSMPSTKPPGSVEAKGEVYVIMRFKDDVTELVRTACFKEKKVIENYDGRVLGIANGVTIYEGNCWPADQAMLVLQFSSQKKAQLWLDSDRKFRDKEWPSPSSGLDIVMVPLCYKPSKTALTFQLIELYDFLDEKFQAEYVSKVTPIMDKYLIKHGVVATYKVENVRNGWVRNGSFFVLNAYDSPVELDAFYYSDDYCALKEYRQHACRTENIVFTLDPNLTPPVSQQIKQRLT